MPYYNPGAKGFVFSWGTILSFCRVADQSAGRTLRSGASVLKSVSVRRGKQPTGFRIVARQGELRFSATPLRSAGGHQNDLPTFRLDTGVFGAKAKVKKVAQKRR